MYDEIKKKAKMRRWLMNGCWIIILVQFLINVSDSGMENIALMLIIPFIIFLGLSVYYNIKSRDMIDLYAQDKGYPISTAGEKTRVLKSLRSSSNEQEFLEVLASSNQ